MNFDHTENVSPPGTARSGGSWREIAPVVATSKDGIVYGRLETRVEDDPRDLARQLSHARRDGRRSADLLAAACRDLRQPLQVIVLALNHLTTSQSATSSAGWLAAAHVETESLAAGLVDLAQAAGLTEPVIAPILLGDLLRKAADAWRQHATSRGQHIVVVECGLSVRAEPQLLLTAVRNLIGDVVGHTRSGRILVGARRRAAGLRIDVIGSGSGLDLDAARALFEQHQGSADSEGLMPRLAIVRDAAERLGVQLSLACLPGQGVRFSLTLPAAT